MGCFVDVSKRNTFLQSVINKMLLVAA